MRVPASGCSAGNPRPLPANRKSAISGRFFKILPRFGDLDPVHGPKTFAGSETTVFAGSGLTIYINLDPDLDRTGSEIIFISISQYKTKFAKRKPFLLNDFVLPKKTFIMNY
jgi:hypothetical protein